MCFSQSNSGKIHINHCRFDIAVTKDSLKTERIASVLDVVGSEGVAVDVGSNPNTY